MLIEHQPNAEEKCTRPDKIDDDDDDDGEDNYDDADDGVSLELMILFGGKWVNCNICV